jgi:hypothetical protein
VSPSEKYLLILGTGLTAAVLVRIVATGLITTYKLLVVYLALDLVQSLASYVIPIHTNRYAYMYFCFQTLKIVTAAFILANIYSLALERRPALARFGRNSVGYALAASGFIPLIGLAMDHSVTAGRYPILRAFFLFEQTMDATTGIFLILISGVIWWFAVPMRRNLMVYLGGFVLWSLSHSVLIHAVNLRFDNAQFKHAAEALQASVSMACLLFWLVGFARSGESRTVVVAPLRGNSDADLLAGRLDAINTRIEHLARFNAG